MWEEFLGSALEAGIGYPSGRFEPGFGKRHLRHNNFRDNGSSLKTAIRRDLALHL